MDFIQQIKDFINPSDTALILLALILFAIGIQLLMLIFWKRVKGTVMESYLEEKKGRKKTLYRPVIIYSYSYADTEHRALQAGC